MTLSILQLKGGYDAWSENRFTYYSHYRIMWWPFKGCEIRDPLSAIITFGVFKFIQSNSTTIKPAYYISAISTESSAVHFDINTPHNPAETVVEFGIGFMVLRASLRCIQCYLNMGLHSAPMEKMTSFRPKSTRWYYDEACTRHYILLIVKLAIRAYCILDMLAITFQ